MELKMELELQFLFFCNTPNNLHRVMCSTACLASVPEIASTFFLSSVLFFGLLRLCTEICTVLLETGSSIVGNFPQGFLCLRRILYYVVSTGSSLLCCYVAYSYSIVASFTDLLCCSRKLFARSWWPCPERLRLCLQQSHSYLTRLSPSCPSRLQLSQQQGLKSLAASVR